MTRSWMKYARFDAHTQSSSRTIFTRSARISGGKNGNRIGSFELLRMDRLTKPRVRLHLSFLDADLERKRVELVRSARDLLERLVELTWPLDELPDVYGIPRELRGTDPERLDRDVATLNLATHLFKEQDQFARYARRKLLFDLEDLDIQL